MRCIGKAMKEVLHMTLSDAEVLMMRLIKQAIALGLVVAQDYQTREVMVFAPTGGV